ncbi:MAG TPA: hypothetical protein VF533_01880 [Solirubrobacteraceae bacterium]|jgi:hypothetical protein
MEIPKEKILELLQQRGKHDEAAQADQELPGQVDPERDSGLLSKFGLDPQDLMGLLGGLGGGGAGGALGGLKGKFGL